MHIQRIHLTNFRNLGDLTVEFAQQTNVILGGNAQGKTNLLEAIHILGVGRSHRDRKDANLVKFGESFYRIEGIFDQIGVRTTIEVSYSDERKRIRINGKEARAASLIGLVGVVISSPDDMELIKGSPGFRRTFLDTANSQISREYLATLQQYARAVAQRNVILKSAQENRARIKEIMVWDRKLVELGGRIVEMRISFLKAIQPSVEENFGLISGGKAEIDLAYETRGYKLDLEQDVRAGLEKALSANREMELVRGYTLFGPHVDDLRFIYDGRDIRQFGSEGEQRTAVLALRCAETNTIKDRMGRYPIVLFDDVFAELDHPRSRSLTALISDFDQIILTTSRAVPVGDADTRRIVIADGRISYNDGT